MKEKIILNLIYFIVSFTIVFLIYVLFVNRKRKVYKEGKKANDINYIVNKFNLDMRRVNYTKLKWTLSIVNSLIISITFVVVTNIDSLTFGLLVGFVVMLMLIYSSYEIIGRILKKRGSKNV